MGRRTNRREITEIITRLRNAVPEIAIRTSLISGFPGQTDEDHLETLDFIKSMKLDRVGVFTYSKEENTPAYRMKNQIKAAVKKKRRQELMLAQQECVFEKNKALIGKRLDVIIDGRIPEDNINDSCRRVLTLKFRLGLFENPYTDENRYKEIINSKPHLEKALEIAQKSIILLKNNGILPLQKGKYRKIALIGPSSDKIRLGGYSAKTFRRKLETIYDVLKSELPDSEILQCDGCGISDGDFEFALSDQHHLQGIVAEKHKENFEEALRIAEESDLIIFCGGDDTISSGEGRDRCELTLCGKQSELIGKLGEIGKPIVFAMLHGKPLAIKDESDICDAVISNGHFEKSCSSIL